MFFGRMLGPGSYRFDKTALLLSARVRPDPTVIMTAWCVGTLFLCGLPINEDAPPASIGWVVIFFFGLFLIQTGVFSSRDELRLERSNVERVEADGARVTLQIRGLFRKQSETVAFVVSLAECPRFFSRFEEVFSGMLPGDHAQTARRVERFHDAIMTAAC